MTLHKKNKIKINRKRKTNLDWGWSKPSPGQCDSFTRREWKDQYKMSWKSLIDFSFIRPQLNLKAKSRWIFSQAFFWLRQKKKKGVDIEIRFLTTCITRSIGRCLKSQKEKTLTWAFSIKYNFESIYLTIIAYLYIMLNTFRLAAICNTWKNNFPDSCL